MSIQKITTPKGELEWVTITGEGKENLSGKMQYVASLILDPDNNKADKEFIASIDAFWDENKPIKKDAKSLGYYAHKVKDAEPDADGDATYTETGKVLLSFKTGISFPDGSPKVVKTYNSKAKPVALGDIKIGNGSIGQIAGAMGIYQVNDPKGKKIIDAGVTLYLDSIKISKLVEFTQDAGFDADEDSEDGFTGDEGWTGTEEGASAPAEGGPRL